ncbi:MAG: hypothetical protein V9E83_03220 [Baekduia sp.]
MPGLSYANVMSTIAVFLALGGGAWAVTAEQKPVTVSACVKKAGAQKGQLRVVSATAKCRKTERNLKWTSASTTTPVSQQPGTSGSDGVNGASGVSGASGAAGPTGPAGPAGATGPAGADGAPGAQGPQGVQGVQGPAGTSGSADTPLQILTKLSTVDGDGSGLDASLLDGHDSTFFLSTSGKAADANLLDGINSSSFARKSTSSSGLISFGAISAQTCVDLNLSLGGVDAGDIVVVRENTTALPTGVMMTTGAATAAGNVRLRLCNVRASASAATTDFPIRWYAFTP